MNAVRISVSVFINDDESGLHADYEAWLERQAPENPHCQFAHDRGQDDADAHLKRTIMGREVVVASPVSCFAGSFWFVPDPTPW